MSHGSVEWLLRTRASANGLDRPADEAGSGGVADVVRRTVGLQAQSWRGAAHAVRARSTATTWADVVQAREVDRCVVRGWFQRGTLQLVATSDAGWLLELLGPGLIRGTERRYGELGLSAETRERAVDVLESCLAANGPAGRAAIGELFVSEGLLPSPRGQAVYALIRHAGLLGRVCYGPGYDAAETWVSVESWLGKPLSALAAPAALAAEGPATAETLARRYLAAYGPATAADLATWSGLSVPVSRRAIEAVADRVVTVEGSPYAMVGEPGESESVRLLGEFDAYLLGYRDRRLMVPEAYARQIHPGGGMLKPAIVQAGRVIGTWTHDGPTAARNLTLWPTESANLTPEQSDQSRFAQ
ncbi:winged helix DNA-binding domain-containing protein [Kribbella sp. NBC_01245]|uniref:winged helix DNA-binding domain-containing protein n=1 Tax=Kribbella sp. NBC_01245 TaxID=2903578 RepID=UPI002E28E34F|nr:winged helix DNA-binding domain-containing protein [Kribbella sp. NBC_01245]